MGEDVVFGGRGKTFLKKVFPLPPGPPSPFPKTFYLWTRNIEGGVGEKAGRVLQALEGAY